MAAWRIFLTHAQMNNAKIVHLDVVNAFLHGDVPEDVYMQQIPCFEDSEHPDWVCKLDKALYGLKQASRIFYQFASKCFIEYGMKVDLHEPCHFFKKNSNGSWLDLILFVDDINIAGTNNEINKFIKHISQKMMIKIIGELTRYVGVNVSKDEKGSILLNQ